MRHKDELWNVLGIAGAAALSFFRNIFIASKLTLADYGIATTFVVALSLYELVADLGARHLVLQSKLAEHRSFIPSLHTIQLLKGLILSFIGILAAPMIGKFFEQPNSNYSYMLIATIPVIKGLENLDALRQMRQGKYKSIALYRVVPLTISLVVVVIGSHIITDYKLMIVALMVQFITGTIVSHITAQRGFKLKLETAVVKRLLRFGMPLLANGMILFGLLQGDRILLVKNLTFEDLAIYSMALTICMTSYTIFSTTIAQSLVPRISRNYKKSTRNVYAEAAMLFNMYGGGVLYCSTALFAYTVTSLMLPNSYEKLYLIIPILLIQCVAFTMRGGASAIFISLGKTELEVTTTALRVTFLIPTAILLHIFQDLRIFIFGAIAGEIFSGLTALVLVARTRSVPLQSMVQAFFIVAISAFLGFTSLTLYESSVYSRVGLVLLSIGIPAYGLIRAGRQLNGSRSGK
jgi:O-antigen/teichoic acid export membrane protein